MNDATKWVIGLIIVIAIVWFGYTSMQDDTTMDTIDTEGTVEMVDTEIDESIDPTATVDETAGTVDETETVQQ